MNNSMLTLLNSVVLIVLIALIFVIEDKNADSMTQLQDNCFQAVKLNIEMTDNKLRAMEDLLLEDMQKLNYRIETIELLNEAKGLK